MKINYIRFLKAILVVLFIFNFQYLALAQDDIAESEETLSVGEQLDELLQSLSSLQANLKKNKRKRPVGRKIKLITKKIIKAVNSIPPEACMETLRLAMDDFYELVSDLGLGIACGPPILPPFLPGEDDNNLVEPLSGDCLPPPDELFERLQIGGPFGGSFADVNPIYNEARNLFQIDTDKSNISDVCEGEVE